jgi:hypothetical protein
VILRQNVLKVSDASEFAEIHDYSLADWGRLQRRVARHGGLIAKRSPVLRAGQPRPFSAAGSEEGVDRKANHFDHREKEKSMGDTFKTSDFDCRR